MSTAFPAAQLPTRIAVVHSGGGPEASVSLLSAAHVCAALSETFAFVETFPLDVDLRSALFAWCPDVVFPVAHGDGEIGELQALLQSSGLIFVGSDRASSARCWDKVMANHLVTEGFQHETWLAQLENLRAAVPPFVSLRQGDDVHAIVGRFCDTQTPDGAVVIKPATDGSSIGVWFCTLPGNENPTRAEVAPANGWPITDTFFDQIVQCVEQAFTFAAEVIVQSRIFGTEITVGVLDDHFPKALPVLEIVRPTGASYSEGGSEYIIPARLPESWLRFAQEAAVFVHRQLGCRDYSRIDFMVERSTDESEPSALHFLKANPSPSFTQTSLFSDAARAAGHTMPSLVKRLVLQAWERRRAGGIADPHL